MDLKELQSHGQAELVKREHEISDMMLRVTLVQSNYNKLFCRLSPSSELCAKIGALKS